MPSGTDLAQDLILIAVLMLAAGLWLAVRRARRRPAPLVEATEAVSTEVTDRPWVAVVANPTKVDDIEGRTAWVKRVGADHGLAPAIWLLTTVHDSGRGQARTALDIGASAVLAFGGDGTVRAVAAELAGGDVPLGVLPAGTGNLLARNLGIPLGDLDAALTVALSGQERRIDVARAEVDVSGEDQLPRREPFLVMAGLGFDAEVMASVGPRLKERVGWFAYVVAGLRLIRGRQTRVAIHLDGGPVLQRRIRTVIVGNCGELTGGLRLLPDALVDDGWLDVVVVSPRGIVGWAAVTASVLSGSRWGHPVMQRFRCREVEIRAEKPLQMQLDGDPAGAARVLRARVDPQALVIRVPSRA